MYMLMADILVTGIEVKYNDAILDKMSETLQYLIGVVTKSSVIYLNNNLLIYSTINRKFL